MTTWSFRARPQHRGLDPAPLRILTRSRTRGALAAICLTALTACEDGQGGLSLGAPTASATPPNTALPKAEMAFGEVTLVPPQGYCIDKKNLQQRFAILARCDALGDPDSALGAPRGIITASLSKTDPAAPLPDAATTAEALKLQNVSAERKSAKSVIFRAEGPAPIAGMAPQHWRATAQIGSQLLGLAFYGPADGRAVTLEGRDMLLEMISATAKGS